jgi:hypothetical protein
MLQKEKFPLLRKILYCLCIAFLFYVLGRWGMYNFRYYQKEAGLQWGVVFLIVSLMIDVWMLFTKMVDDEWMLIGFLSLMMILVTPLGSNNYVWPVLNNLFFTAPVTFWMVYKFARWGRQHIDSEGRVPLFPVKAMVSAMVIAFFVQSLGLGVSYVFLDGETGLERTAKVENNRVLTGMYTTEENAAALSSLSGFMEENTEKYREKKVILYGNIPGLSYYLDREPAVFSSWPDLDTNSLEQLRRDLQTLTEHMQEEGSVRPLVILGTEAESCEKLEAVQDFMSENGYREAFANEAFTVYE